MQTYFLTLDVLCASPEFQEILPEIETGFNERRDSIGVELEKKGLL